MIELGKVYRDRASGFVGLADARAEYLYTTPQVRLVADTGPTGDRKERWVEEAQIDPHGDDSRVGFGAT